MAERYTSRTLREIVRIIASRFLGMVIILALFISGAIFINYVSPRKYRTEIKVSVRLPGEGRIDTGKDNEVRARLSQTIQKQIQIIQSNDTIATALYLMKNPPKSVGGIKNPWLTDIKTSWDTKGVNTVDLKLTEKQIKDIRKLIKNDVVAISKIKKRISVITPGGSDALFTGTFTIQVNWEENRKFMEASTEKTREVAAEDCLKFANLLYKAYRYQKEKIQRQLALTDQKFSKEQGLAKIDAELDEVNKEDSELGEKIGKDMSIVKAIATGQGGTDSGIQTEINGIKLEIRELERKYVKEDFRQKSILGQLRTEKDLVAKLDPEFNKKESLGGDADNVPSNIATQGEKVIKINFESESINQNPRLNQLQVAISQDLVKLNRLMGSYTDEFPKVKEAKRTIFNNYCSLIRLLIDQYEEIKLKKEICLTQDRKLKSRLKDLEDRLSTLNELGLAYKRVSERRENIIKRKDEAIERRDKAAADVAYANISTQNILQSPSLPDPEKPRRPITFLNLILGIFAGMVFALAYAFLSDYFDHTIKSVDDAERYLGTPVLTSVPKLGKNIIR